MEGLSGSTRFKVSVVDEEFDAESGLVFDSTANLGDITDSWTAVDKEEVPIAAASPEDGVTEGMVPLN